MNKKLEALDELFESKDDPVRSLVHDLVKAGVNSESLKKFGALLVQELEERETAIYYRPVVEEDTSDRDEHEEGISA